MRARRERKREDESSKREEERGRELLTCGGNNFSLERRERKRDRYLAKNVKSNEEEHVTASNI